MTDEQMMAALAALPDAELMTEGKITDHLCSSTYYSARTVVKLLAAERERCAMLCERVASDLEGADEDGQSMSIGAQSCADQIRAVA